MGDLTGITVSGIEVIGPAGKRKNRAMIWQCRCHCGNIFETAGYNFGKSHIKSCGCLSANVVEAYKRILSGSLQRFPKSTWIPMAEGLSNAKKVTRFLFDEYLKWPKEDITTLADGEIFRKYKLDGMITYIFGKSVVDAIENAYPGIFDSKKTKNIKHEKRDPELGAERLKEILKGRSHNEVLDMYSDDGFIEKHGFRLVFSKSGLSKFDFLDLAFPNEYSRHELMNWRNFWEIKKNRADTLYWLMDKTGKMCITMFDVRLHIESENLIRHYGFPQMQNALKEVLNVPMTSSFVKFLVQIQQKLGLSDAEISERIGVHEDSYSIWRCNCGIRPDFLTIVKICDSLEINLRKTACSSFEDAVRRTFSIEF